MVYSPGNSERSDCALSNTAGKENTNSATIVRMTTVNVHEARTQLSRLLERVRAGEEIVIAKAGAPCARLVPLDPPPERACSDVTAIGTAMCRTPFSNRLTRRTLQRGRGRSE